MYNLTEQQTDYILSDIRRRGVEMEDLQLNLLDHVCCIVEQNLKDGDDFEDFYQKTIKQFFKHELWEIEEETITLLTFKNYYAMKKTMIMSGATSVALLLLGSFFKIMHWPGASMLLILGIGILSFLFLPLVFFFKRKENSNSREKLITGLGAFLGILLCMSTLFKVMHWPGAGMLWISSSAFSIFVFIPIYFFTGIRKQEAKVNTIVTTVILIGATGLLFTLTSIRKSKQLTSLETKTFYKSEQLLKKLRSVVQTEAEKKQTYNDILGTCDKLKEIILQSEIGTAQLPADFESKNIVIYEGGLGEEFNEGGSAVKLLTELKNQVNTYNLEKKNELSNESPLNNTILEGNPAGIFSYSNLAVLNALNQIELFVAAGELKPAITK